MIGQGPQAILSDLIGCLIWGTIFLAYYCWPGIVVFILGLILGALI